jgi:hypothetical protein
MDIKKGFRVTALKDGDADFRAFLPSNEPTSLECPECDVPLNKIPEREKTIVSLMGIGKFRRAYYQCTKWHWHFVPCNDIVGVSGTSFTPGVSLVVSKLISQSIERRHVMGYPTKIQLIKRKESEQWYVNFPTQVAQAMEFEKGETVEWFVEDKATLALKRREAPEPILKK